MSDPFACLSDAELRALPRSEPPEWTAPMLATLTDERFSYPAWIYERKLDGERALAFRTGKTVRLMSRNRQDLNGSYPELVDALESQPFEEFVVDGEIVAFEGGRTSFSRLQQRLQIADPERARASGVAVFYYLFDILHLDGRTIDGLPLRTRKSMLRDAMEFKDPLRFTPHRNRDGEKYLEEACRKGWEGLIAKCADAPYRHSRSRDWLKLKCSRQQELVIGGFTEPKGERTGFGALLVGYYEGDRLHYAGKVGTGFDNTFLREFRGRLDEHTRKTSPFADPPRETGVTWVTPNIVGEFEFTEWTEDGKLRHPRFLGLRRDKEAHDVRRELPQAD